MEWRADEYVYVQLADLVGEQIERGDLAPGTKLPSEIEMADAHGIARLTARRAVRLLAERGLVRTLPGKGTFVVEQAGDEAEG
jgi:DNA-binding GntR family transcriptional regulator